MTAHSEPLDEATGTETSDQPELVQEPRIEVCTFCGEPYLVGESTPEEEWYCTRCGERLTDYEEVENNVKISHIFALAGLIMLLPAFTMSMLSIEQFGNRTDAGLVEGVLKLFRSGEYFLGTVIGLLSGVLPCIKLMGMVVLTSRRFIRLKHHRVLYRFVEVSGRWGMIDVFLAALMIYGFKFSEMFPITPGPGLVAFCVMVFCNLLSTGYFDTRIYRRHFSD